MRRLALVITGAVTAVTATLAAFWAARRPRRDRRRGSGGAKRRGGSGTAAPTSANRRAGSGSAGAAEPRPAEGLQAIKGIGAVSEERLREIGVTSVAQVAAWSPEDIEAIAGQIKVSAERIRREDWVGQARTSVESAG